MLNSPAMKRASALHPCQFRVMVAGILLSVGAAFGQEPARPPTLSLELPPAQPLVLRLIQPGSFEEGSPATEPDREDDETPRRVTLTRAFYISDTVVTKGQFQRFVEETRYRTEAETGASGGFGVVNGQLAQRREFTWRNPGFEQTPDHPVTLVTYDDALAFCRWLSRQARRPCTLPTEAQWEYACRAGTLAPRSGEPRDAVAWHRENSDGITHPVRLKTPNAWGLYDAYGPVWQWCLDWYGPYAGTAIDPLQSTPPPGDKARRVLRGGSFLSGPARARSAERYRNDPHSRNADNGFRIVAGLEQSAQAEPLSPVPSTSPRPAPPANVSTTPTPTPAPAEHRPFIPPPVTAATSVTGGVLPRLIGALVLLCIGAGIITWIIYKFVGGSGRGVAVSRPSMLAQAARANRFHTRIADDGFWIEGPPEAAGELLHYRYVAGEQTAEQDVAFSPGPKGMFIYTATRPTSVALSPRNTGGGIEAGQRLPGSATPPDLDVNVLGQAAAWGTYLSSTRAGRREDPPRTPHRDLPPAY